MTNQTELTAERISRSIDHLESMSHCGYGPMRDTCAAALAALRAEQERLNPQPLAWEELSGMVGEPVWTIGECCGLDGCIEEVYEDSILFGRSTEQPEKWRYNLRKLSGELSGCAWLAYRTKPEGREKHD